MNIVSTASRFRNIASPATDFVVSSLANKEIFENATPTTKQYITSYSNRLTIRDDFVNGKNLIEGNNYSVIYNGDEVDLGSFKSMIQFIHPYMEVSQCVDDGSRDFDFSDLNFQYNENLDKKKWLEAINKIGKNFNIFFLTTPNTT